MKTPTSLVRGLSLGLALTCFFTTVATALDLIQFESNWDYMHPTDGVDPAIADEDFDTTWFLDEADFDANYNGPAFGTAPAISGPPIDSGNGPAPIGYDVVNYIRDNYPDNADNAGLATVLTRPADEERRTAYFRHEFVVADDVESLALEIIADDGAVIYLDGEEFLRVNVTAADTWDANSSGTTNEGALRRFEVFLGGLASGPHVLAISIHQSNTGSSDLGFDLRLNDEGRATSPMGTTDFGGSETEFVIEGGLNGWLWETVTGEYLLENADGGTLMSEEVDLSAQGDVLFTVDLRLDENSGASNFEAADSFAARLEVNDGATTSDIVLTPFGFDTNQDGTITGDEIFPDLASSQAIDLRHVMAAEIPANIVSARLIIEAINNSASEQFRFNNARFTDMQTSLVLGTNEKSLVPTDDLGLLVGPNAWVEDAVKRFSLNNADADGGGRVLASREFDLSLAGASSVSLDLEAEVTSTNTNFEDGDTFAAWVEVLDSDGFGHVVQLVNGGNDADGNHVLSDEEFAPGADPTLPSTSNFTLAANLPSNAVKAQLFIAAEIDAGNETFRLSDVIIGDPIAPPLSFQIVNISHATGTSYDITFESAAGETYTLQFGSDLTAGSFADVGLSIVGAAGTTTTNHNPGAIDEGFYRVTLGGVVVGGQ